jgi:hypothetical protein
MILAGICCAVYEIIYVAYDNSIFRNLNPEYWNPKMSWIYKWSSPIKQGSAPKRWYHFGMTPQRPERFPYSSTIFVALTDAWHLFKSIMLLCIMVSLVNYTEIINPIVDTIIFYVCFTFPFEMFYTYILRVKNK